MSMERTKTRAPGTEYKDGRTKQAFKDQTDINKILARAQKGEAISHLAKHGATYGDFSDIDDLLTANQRLERGTEIFAELPAEIKREFRQSPAEFFNFVNDPANAGDLERVLPGLTERGNQKPVVDRSRAASVPDATLPPEPQPDPDPTPEPPAAQ